MTLLHNPLSKPTQATSNQLSIYLEEVNYVNETNLLTLSVGLLSDTVDIRSLGLRLHFDGNRVNYTEDKAYSLSQSQADIPGQGIDDIINSGKISSSGHIATSDVLTNYDEDQNTTHFVKTNWITDYGSDPMSAFPGVMDADLFDINFTVTNQSAPISFGFSADSNDLKEGYSLSSSALKEFVIDLSVEDGDIVQSITINHQDGQGVVTQISDRSLTFVTSDTERTTLSVVDGELNNLSTGITFTHVTLENQNYDKGISLSDAILQLEHIVNISTLTGANAIAADVNGDGNISLSDAIITLEHIVNISQINTCNLLNDQGEIVVELTPSTISELNLIQSGDVNLSASFVDLT